MDVIRSEGKDLWRANRESNYRKSLEVLGAMFLIPCFVTILFC